MADFSEWYYLRDREEQICSEYEVKANFPGNCIEIEFQFL